MTAVAEAAFAGTYNGARVFLTGHTGFKGSWLARWLLELGATVHGYALEPDTQPSLFADLGLEGEVHSTIADIRNLETLSATIESARPDFVFHLAAQPLVRRSYAEPILTYETNVMGTINLLESVRRCDSVQAVVVATTDKVYANPESGIPFAEAEPLGGHDPYSASKACAEIVAQSYRSSFLGPAGRPALATARAGNVIGGGDWADDRILPDCIRALLAGESVQVRNPGAVRPWQHVLDPLSGYLHLGACLAEAGVSTSEAWNFGPDSDDVRTVGDVVDRVVAEWGQGSWHVPVLTEQPHEAGLLRLDVTKTHSRLGWRSVWGFEQSVSRTVGWYRDVADGTSARDATAEDIRSFVKDAQTASAVWA